MLIFGAFLDFYDSKCYTLWKGEDPNTEMHGMKAGCGNKKPALLTKAEIIPQKQKKCKSKSKEQ